MCITGDIKILRTEGQKQFLSGRGCPHRCNFCFNAQFQDIFRGLGRYVRKKSVDIFIEEIKRTKDTYGAKVIFSPMTLSPSIVDGCWNF